MSAENEEELIPAGMYCYELLRIEYNKDGYPVKKIRQCPHYIHVHDNYIEGGFCNYLTEKDDDPWFIDDMCKDCGIKFEDEEI